MDPSFTAEAWLDLPRNSPAAERLSELDRSPGAGQPDQASNDITHTHPGPQLTREAQHRGALHIHLSPSIVNDEDTHLHDEVIALHRDC